MYFERFEDVHNAVEREQEIKGWLRIKIALIVPAWRDLKVEWYERHAFQPDTGIALAAAKNPSRLSS